VYLTPKKSKGFRAHFDTHDVFVLQAHGQKNWRIYAAPIELPLQSQSYDPSQFCVGRPLLELQLCAGDLLYLPRGYIHEGTASGDSSLHITLGVLAYTWADLLTEALSLTSLAHSSWRKSLPIGFAMGTGVGVGEQFRDLLKTFIDNVDGEQARRKLAERFVGGRLPLMYDRLGELSSAEKLSVDSELRVKPTVIFLITIEGDSLQLLFEGKRLRMPVYVEPILRYIREAQTFRIGQLPDVLDEAGKMVLARRLVKEGFLQAVTPGCGCAPDSFEDLNGSSLPSGIQRY
jgi:hypothetical protein